MKKLVIFASGAGSNAERIILHFAASTEARVALLVCNKPGAGVLAIARQHEIPSFLITQAMLDEPSELIKTLENTGADLLVLAGFLRKIPDAVLHRWKGRIVNIHPSLLPKFGGKGMYGNHVHKAVIEAGEKESGITIHQVTADYDEGEIIEQVRCAVLPGDTPELLAARVQQLEHTYYPKVLTQLITTSIPK